MRREYDRIVAALVLALGAYAAALAWIAPRHPESLGPLAAAAAAALARERGRARPRQVVGRGLAPGSLGLFPRGPWVDHRFFAKQVARHGPIFKYSLQHRPCVCVLGASLGSELIRSHADALVAPPVRFNRFVPKGFLRYMSPADHPHYKRAFANAFDARILAAREPELRRIARRGFQRLVRESSAGAADGCAPRPLLHALVFEMLVAAFYGVRPEDPGFAWLRERYEDLDLRKVTLVSGTRDRDALASLEAWAQERGREIRRDRVPGSAPDCFLAAIAAAGGEALEDETMLGNLVYVLSVARAVPTELFHCMLTFLGDAPALAGR